MNKRSKLIASLMVSTAVLGVSQIQAAADTIELPVATKQATENTADTQTEAVQEAAIDEIAADETLATEQQTQDPQQDADLPALRSADDEAQQADDAVLSGTFDKTMEGSQDLVDLENGASWEFKDGTLTISDGNIPSLFVPTGKLPNPGGTFGNYLTGKINYEDIKNIVFTGTVVFPEDSSWVFSYLPNLESVTSTGTIDTSKATKMQGLFWNDPKITDLSGIENWDVSNVKSLMTAFFNSGNESLKLDLSKWDTSNVENFYATFRDLVADSINLTGSFSTSSATDMHQMFKGNMAFLISGLSEFDTSNATNFNQIFEGASFLSENGFVLDLSGWNTSNVEQFQAAFNGSGFTELNLSGWNTAKAGTGAEGQPSLAIMFSNMAYLEKLDISGFDLQTSSPDIENMFINSNKIWAIKLGDKTIMDQLAKLHDIQSGQVWQNTSNPDLPKPDGDTKFETTNEFVDGYNANPAGWYVIADTTTQAYQNNPEGQDITVELNEKPSADAGISNAPDLTGNPTFEFKEEPDTSVAGDFPATIVVTYEDGSKDEIQITIHVKPAPTPETPEQGAKTPEAVKPADKNVLPNTSATNNSKNAMGIAAVVAPFAALAGLAGLRKKNQK